LSPNTPRRNLIIGTAGHIDHGKTVLVKALTGRDTDRLAEEKERGISIDLGFAPLTLSDGSVIGVVDVPGHENFVRNMMAGATGVDLALLVVAADDGVMPQTREHLAILELLGVRRGVVAITKIDTVDSEMVELVDDEVAELLEDTPLEGSPIVPVSAVTGEGIDELRGAIEREAASVRLRDEELPARMPIDRVFTLRGIGTVVTGTLWSGSLSVGQRLELLPQGEEVRVRSLEVHDSEREEVFAGERVAVNLAGTPRDSVSRGDVLAEPGVLRPTWMADARVRVLADWPKAVKRGARIRFHHGTREVLGRIYPMEGERIAPGQGVPSQLRLEEKVVLVPGDRFVMRSYSPVTTIGGGIIVDTHPVKHRLHDPEALDQFAKLESGEAAALAAVHLQRAGRPLSASALAQSSGIPLSIIYEGLEALAVAGPAVTFGEGQARLYLLRDRYIQLLETTLVALERFHTEKPLAAGMAKETLKKQLVPDWDARSADVFMDALEKAGAIEAEGRLVRLPGAGASVTSEQESALDSIVVRIQASPFAPPTVSELSAEMGQPKQATSELLALAEKDGRLVRVSPELYFSRAAVADIEAKLRASVSPAGITVSDFKNMLSTSRKYALPLLEYFDRTRVTARVGDVRKLR
jgi:selenocysteine-specific elongation factor